MLERTALLPAAEAPEWLQQAFPGIDLRAATTFSSRLRGLAGSEVRPQRSVGLVLPGTKSIHTFGMAFPLDLFWLTRDGGLLRFDAAVPPGRIRTCGGAAEVIELAAAAATVA